MLIVMTAIISSAVFEHAFKAKPTIWTVLLPETAIQVESSELLCILRIDFNFFNENRNTLISLLSFFLFI